MLDNSARTFRVFLCHASDDKPDVRELFRKLTDEGIDVWFDEEKLIPGQDWEMEISKGLRSADAIIICISKESTEKEGYVQKELRKALDIAQEKPDGTIFLIPVRLDNCPVPVGLAGIQYVDLYDPSGYQKLLSSLKVRAGKFGIKLAGIMPTRPPTPDKNYEFSRMITDIFRDDTGLNDVLVHLQEREPEELGWFHIEIRKELLHIMSDQNRPVMERVRAGDALAQIGDPRFRPDAWSLPDDEMLGFVEIPSGVFQMGNDKLGNEREAARESPQHLLDLPKFYINRFPVTVAQYMAFLRGTSSIGQIDAKIAALENNPIGSVTWHAAMRYCQWLTGILRSWPDTPKKVARILATQENGSSWVVSLPSEAQWEKAARGMADARSYPWGFQPDPTRANFDATHLKRVCPVGCFNSGKSPYGIYDMSGNVWEWTRTNWGPNMERPLYKYPYHPEDGREDLRMEKHVLRVMRGGSYINRSEEIRCSHRSAEFPNINCEIIGFRLAITLLAQ